MKTILSVRGLKKSYGNRTVLKGLDLEVRQGEIFALLGVNGAGKTTALECIEGLRTYDQGEITVDGNMGIQLQSSSLPEHIRPMEAVRLFAAWNHVCADPSVLEAFGIGQLGKKQYYQLSTGQKRRLHLALALTADPDILFLDEPTAGLDVEGRGALHQQIRKLKSRGKTILLSSHDMAEVESLCDRIAILTNGKIAFCGTAQELGRTVGNHYRISVRTPEGTQQITADDIGAALLTLLSQYRDRGIPVLDVRTDRGSLEQLFMKIAKGE